MVRDVRTTILLVALSVSVVGGARPVLAHHAFTAEFDVEKPVKLTGTVVRVEWINPHSWFHIEVKKADGTSETWAIEAGAPSALFRRGVTKASLPIGTVVVATGYQAKDGTLKANGRDFTFPDGRRLFVSSPNAPAPDGTTFAEPPPSGRDSQIGRPPKR